MQSVRNSPFRELVSAEKKLSKLLDRGWNMMPGFVDVSPVDMYVEDGKLITAVALPNFKKNEVEVTATSEGLEISAEHKEKEEKETKNRRYLLRESSQSYWRRLSLPPEAKADDVKCVLKDGKLTVTMPLKEQTTTKKILIE